MTTAGRPAERERATLLVVAKAPVPGEAKTRLGAELGMEAAADLAAAALLDTLALAGSEWAAHVLAWTGDLDAAARADDVRAAISRWQVVPQVGAGFAERLVRAHAAVAALRPGPVVQIGMDTPQLTGGDLTALHHALDDADAALGPALDGGWWGLALRRPDDAVCLVDVPMSQPQTGAATVSALTAKGLRVTIVHELRDVDTTADAARVASACEPRSNFSKSWSRASVRLRSLRKEG